MSLGLDRHRSLGYSDWLLKLLDPPVITPANEFFLEFDEFFANFIIILEFLLSTRQIFKMCEIY